MSNKKTTTDAYQWSYDHYIKGNPELERLDEVMEAQEATAQQVYDIRNKLRMTQADLAELSNLPLETIDDIEESDYDGDWDEAVDKINRAFHHWFTDVIQPAALMKPEDYSVKAVNA